MSVCVGVGFGYYAMQWTQSYLALWSFLPGKGEKLRCFNDLCLYGGVLLCAVHGIILYSWSFGIDWQ